MSQPKHYKTLSQTILPLVTQPFTEDKLQSQSNNNFNFEQNLISPLSQKQDDNIKIPEQTQFSSLHGQQDPQQNQREDYDIRHKFHAATSSPPPPLFKNIDINIPENLLQGSKSPRQDIKNSKAYICAMKALQKKIKDLENLQTQQQQEREIQKKEQTQLILSHQQQSAEYEKALQEEKEKHKSLEEQINTEKEIFYQLENNLKEKLKQIDEENFTLKHQIEFLNQQIEVLKVKAHESDKKRENFINVSIVEKNKTKEEINEANKLVNQIHQENAVLKEDKEALQKQFLQQEEQIAELHKNMANLEDQIQGLEQQNSTLRIENESLCNFFEQEKTSIMEKYQGAKEITNKKMERIMEENAQLRKDCTQHVEAIHSIKDQAYRQEEIIKNISQENELLKKAINDYEYQLNQMKLYSDATKDMNKQLLNTMVLSKEGKEYGTRSFINNITQGGGSRLTSERKYYTQSSQIKILNNTANANISNMNSGSKQNEDNQYVDQALQNVNINNNITQQQQLQGKNNQDQSNFDSIQSEVNSIQKQQQKQREVIKKTPSSHSNNSNTNTSIKKPPSQQSSPKLPATDYEQTIKSIYIIEKELVEMNLHYQKLADDIISCSGSPEILNRLRDNMVEISTRIQNKNDQLFKLKQMEEEMNVITNNNNVENINSIIPKN